MATNQKILLGMFLNRRLQDPDGPDDMYAPGGQVDPENTFLEQHRVDFTPSVRAELPPMPAPEIQIPGRPGPQPAPPLPLSHPPFGPVSVAHPPLTSPAPEGPNPNSPPSAPPADPIRVPRPADTVVAARQPSQLPGTPDVHPFQPAPAPGVRGQLPAPPAFQPGSPGVLPPPPQVQTVGPGAIPAQPAPGPSVPGRVPPPPTVRVGQVGPAPFDPVFERSPRAHAPGGQIDPALDFARQIYQTDAGIREVLSQVKDIYANLGVNDKFAAYVGRPVHTQGDLAVDPFLYAKSVARLGAHLGAAGLAFFAGEQALLFSMNSRGRIWNPLMAAPPPIVQNFIKPTIDLQIPAIGAALGDGIPRVGEPAPDIHRQMAEGNYSVDRILPNPPFFEKQTQIGSSIGGNEIRSGFLGRIGDALKQVGIDVSGPRLVGAASQDTSVLGDVRRSGPIVQVGLRERNAYSPDDPGPSADNADRSNTYGIDRLVDGVLRGSPDRRLLRKEKIGGVERVSLVSVFDARANTSLGSAGEQRVVKSFKGRALPDALVKSSFPRGVIPMSFRGEVEGFHVVKRSAANPPVDDDEAYVPLSFTDLRPINNTYRTVYFRPSITNFSEDFSPEWNKSSYFGRTDSVVTYQSTGRVIQLGFRLAAFSPEDVPVIYKKLNWLTSMVYPEYDNELQFKSGPVVRMRVGDVINAIGPEGTRGLPGIIDGLSLDYNESIWELAKDWKVPRKIDVSLSFTVLHDKPIGRGEEGRFGGIGTFDSSGRYLPPGQGSSDSKGSTRLAEIKKGLDSFRALGGSRANDQNYEGKKIEDLK